MREHPKLGPFTIIDRIAVGGMGVVYLAEHDDGSAAAVKLLDLPDADDDVPLRLFIQEVQATARLHHDNIIAIYDYGTLPLDVTIERFGPSTPYYVMEYVPRGSLEQHMPQNWEELRHILESALRALAHAHGRGLVHRDIKPANMLVGSEGRLVLTDFGIAHATYAHTSTMSDDLTTSTHENASGTPLYMSPEQFAGAWRDYGAWTDLYALGVVAWHFACGRAPFTAGSFVELGLQHMTKPMPRLEPMFEVPPRFAQWVARMTAKDARDRPRSAAEALVLLRDEELDPRPTWREAGARHRARSSRGTGLGLLGMRQVPTVGRVEARDRLWASVLRGVHEGLDVVHITGPPGTGKSHLAQWCSQLAVECGLAVSYQVDNAAEAPLSGVAGLLHAIFRSAGLEGMKLYERVETFSLETGISVDPRFAVEAMSDAGGALSGEQVFEPAARVLQAVTRKHPMVIWVDDLDASPEIEDFIGYLAERHPEQRMTIVTTSVGEEPPSGGDVLELGFMPDAEVEEILRSQVDLSRRMLDQTLARCQGSPMFAVLLLEDWIDSGRLRPDDGGGLDASSSTFEAQLPESVTEIWARRLRTFVADLAGVRMLGEDRLRVATSPELVQGRLQAAAALGEVVDEAEWNAVCEAHGLRRISFVVDELVRHRLVRRTATGFRFVHGLLREVIAEQAQASDDWRGFNHSAAQVLRAAPRSSPLRLAGYLRAAGQPLEAMSAARDAADRARDTFDVVALGNATDIWAACADEAGLPARDTLRVDLWTMQAYARLLRSAVEDRDEAHQLLKRAAAVASADGDEDVLLRVAARRAVAALYLGDVGERGAELAAALERAGGTDATRFEAQMALARAFSATGDAPAMLEAGQKASRHAASDAQRMQVAQLAGRALLELERLDEARTRMQQANELARANNWVIAEARGYETLAFIADAGGDFSEAARWHRHALELFELVGPRTSYPDKQREYLARALLAAGDSREAAKHLAAVRAGLDSGKVGFWTHLEDAELACAAANGEWAICANLLPAAIAFENFAPYEIHRRALALAAVHAERAGRATLSEQVRKGLVALGADVDSEIAAATKLVID